MSFAVAGANKIVHAIAEGDQAEQIALFLRRQRQQQRCCDVAFQNGRVRIARDGARAEARSIQDDVNLLCPLDLENARDGMAAARGSLPINFIETVARRIFTELFELASLAKLALAVHTQPAALEERRRFLAL